MMILKGHLDTAYVQSGERASYKNILSRDDFCLLQSCIAKNEQQHFVLFLNL